ncbi:MAG: hypothetical protein E6K77_02015 [Candidatus Eisenbacteria bacterium]|uniref:Tetratricopeptide repeat protein n=1 Tax=Eiseniibacteriota bacterium TaxID=2212470 RepID=A0A538TQC5_UNCEI|nr:MAG: hypothetical protein E6K77_02015 [Candidatus Eisenbacteria bacterium]
MRWARWIYPLAVLLSGISVAHAAEDGGTRSIFASGAGNRALGMGGAFVGVADDASAMIWNAGGLGLIQRLELQATHSGYVDLESREDYLSVVLPSWRWGTAGISVRHFGIDGIESRDDGNVLLGDNLSNSETEIALGFGRPVSEAVSVGGTVKLQRQSLAGFSGSGLGADLGVLARPSALLRTPAEWMERLTWGVSVRNVVQPSIRLDQESVHDPSVIRTGFSYQHPSIAGRPALFTLDLEKSRAVTTKVHAGLEVRVHPLLGIRTGINGGRLAAGMAVAWRDFVVDYAFGDGDLSSVHRVGISRSLGRTLAQQREAASRAQEADIQAKLDEAFQIRQTQQLEDLLARAKAAQADSDFDKALEVLATIAILYPGQLEARALEALCHREKGRQLEAHGDYASAAAAFGRAVAIAPDDTAAVAGQVRARIAGDRLAARGVILRRQARSDSDTTAANSPDTSPTVAGAHAIGKTSSRKSAGAPERRVEVESHRAAAPVPEKPRLSPERQREVEKLYTAGLAAMSERRVDDALRYWELAWSMDPGYKRLAEYLKREYLIRGMEFFASGKLDDAMSYWQKALQMDPTDTRAASYIARARTQQARTRELTGEDR